MTAPMPDEPFTVRTVQDFAPLVSVDLLLQFARDAGLPCLCSGRGRVDTWVGDSVCPGCAGSGVAPAEIERAA